MADGMQMDDEALKAFLGGRDPQTVGDVELVRLLSMPEAAPFHPCFWAIAAHPQSLLLAAFTLHFAKQCAPNHPLGQPLDDLLRQTLGMSGADICWAVPTTDIRRLYQLALTAFLKGGNRQGVVQAEALLGVLDESSFPIRRCACCGKVVQEYVPLSPYYAQNMAKYRAGAPAGASATAQRPYVAEMVNGQHYSCPICGAADRERAYALWMARELPRDAALNVLEIAPSPALQGFFRRNFPHISYKSGDLYMRGVDYKLDIMDMHQIADGSIDFFVCSHVLEHVRDDIRAMHELHRILSPRGRGILVVPMDLSQTFIDEDPDCTDPGERWRRFDQDDHVRKYSRQGWIDRLTSVFTLQMVGREFFSPELMEQNALLDTSTLYIVSR